MSSRWIEIARALADAGPRLRKAITDRLLDAVWQGVIERGGPVEMPLKPDPAVRSYWVERSGAPTPRERYEKAY